MGILAPLALEVAMEEGHMRRVGWALLVVVLCTPLAFTVYLVTAARYPALDRVTLTLPMAIRQPVAGIVMQKAGYGDKSTAAIDRVVRIDPDNGDAWSRRCTATRNKSNPAAASICATAIRLAPDSAWNYNALGYAQQESKNFCAAEDSFTTAMDKDRNDAYLIRNMSIAAMRCGHLGAAQSGLEVSETLDAKAAADPDDDEDSKDDLVLDREYLAVVYDRTQQPAKATEVCLKAHPTYKPCHCDLTDKSVACTGSLPHH